MGASLFMILFGMIFFIIGMMLTVNFLAAGSIFGILFAAIFWVVGAVVMVKGVTGHKEKKNITRYGTKIPAKIYGYGEDHSFYVNGQPGKTIKVRYFDQSGHEREAEFPIGRAMGGAGYPIGMTIDIYEYNGRFDLDKKSVRQEYLQGEETLMDDKPVEPGKIRMIATKCPNCGASVQAAAGYSNRCEYCESYFNA